MMWGGVIFDGLHRPQRGEQQVAPTPQQPRDVTLERSLTAQAAEAAGVKCVVLTHFAEDRMRPGPVETPPGRDLLLEVLEELADARNYLVWAATQETLRDEPREEAVAGINLTLELVVMAFDVAIRARDGRSRP